jgi:hypothetical protein
MFDVHELMPLLLTILAVFAGPALFMFTSRFRGFGAALRWATAAAIVAIVALFVLPECWHEAGLWAAGSLILGAAFPVAAERALHAAPRSLSLWLPIVPLVVHAMLDGVTLRLGILHAESAAHAGHAGHGLIAALILHRLPEGMAIFCLARAHGRRTALLALGIDALCTSLGFFFFEPSWLAFGPTGFALFEAFVGGILLHVLLHEPHGHAVSVPT